TGYTRYVMRTNHLNEFHLYTMFFEQSGVPRDEDIQKRNAKSGVGHAHFLGVLRQKGRAILQQDENANRDTDSSVELSRQPRLIIRRFNFLPADYTQRAENLST